MDFGNTMKYTRDILGHTYTWQGLPALSFAEPILVVVVVLMAVFVLPLLLHTSLFVDAALSYTKHH